MSRISDCMGHIERHANRIAEREVDVEKARHAAVLDDVPRRGDHHGRNAVGFEMPCDQTHGLVAGRVRRASG